MQFCTFLYFLVSCIDDFFYATSTGAATFFTDVRVVDFDCGLFIFLCSLLIYCNDFLYYAFIIIKFFIFIYSN